jgi:outer membrane protein assembly factor BamB
MTGGGLVCVRQGKVAWSAALTPGEGDGGTPEPTPIAREEQVYAAAGGGALACFDSAGKQAWKTDVAPNVSGPPMSSPVLCEDLVIVQGRDLEAHRVKDGSLAWRLTPPAGSEARTPVRTRIEDGIVLFTSWGAAARASDGKVLADGFPRLTAGSPVAGDKAVYFCGSAAADEPSVAAAYRLPRRFGDALQPDRLWERRLGFTCDGPALADRGLLYLVDTAQTLHVLDAATGAAVYEQALTPDSGKRAAARAGGDLILAGGALYAANLGSSRRTVIFEPGRAFRKVWEYAVHEATANPAFEMQNQYLCAGNTLYAVGGRTPTEPTAPKVPSVAPAPALDSAADLPLGAFRSDATPANWVVVGPFKPRSLDTDFLAGLGGVSNATLKAGQEVAHRGQAYTARTLGTNEWFTVQRFTAGIHSIDVTKAAGREPDRTICFFTVVEFDSERALEYRFLSPNAGLWNPKSRVDARAWIAGRPIEEGAVFRVGKGRYPLMLQVGVGECEGWGTVWIAPRFADVTERETQRQRNYERTAAEWPRYLADRDRLFVLGEQP